MALEIRPDLILTDMTMPRMDGSELIARILNTPELAARPIIAMSGEQQIDDEVAFFRKPFDPAALIAQIDRLLHGDG
jgi:CheY-like chemotaxis protein